ncbi:adenylate/guanylate cyclase domain-containing protein [Sulfitobacter sp. S190]|uniref:adenylate/guanylate cyclase domain-containing protein n=1 Tax=Sulfitobacter sp. S190 TaxID=2867022 RepID=UPI0021A7EBDB|nr:adenylate/guanylate cyclase domain-containing protein [Sulfitobacter sp. S190]UWR21189.1 adenylate/guanylate cyclase domain-containing protein [Sulfitobacter sp. S190]
MQVVGAAVMADVSNSTPLFEALGDAGAVREINRCLTDIRRDIRAREGVFLHSRGDDVLAFFENADAALQTAMAAVRNTRDAVLRVHAGLGWGEMLRVPDDIYGTPVNMAARLSSLAKAGEVLVLEPLYRQLSQSHAQLLREVDVIRLKGSHEPVRVYSYLAEDPADRTLNFAGDTAPSAGRLQVRLMYNNARFDVAEGVELSIGRASDADLVVAAPWVSRNHATVTVMNGIVVLRDHSTSGTYIRMDRGRELHAHRNSVTLLGAGTVSLGAPVGQAREAVIRYAQTHVTDERAAGD